ncbi:MerR family transcriptional regulator [candidate division KSB1 bacterium]
MVLDSTDLRNEPIFPIGVAAKMIGISPSTIRMYENEGLVVPYKTSTKMRLFTAEDLDWIKNIRSLIKQEKLSVEGIRRILALLPCWKIQKCSDKDKENCIAYNSKNYPCWSVMIESGGCNGIECRACAVYRNAENAFDTRKMLSEYTNY